MQRNYSTFFNPVLMNLLYFVTVTHFSVCLISVFEYILFPWVNIAWKIYYHAKKNVFSGDSTLSFSDSHFFFFPNSSFPKVLFLVCHGWVAMSTAHCGLPAGGSGFHVWQQADPVGLHWEVTPVVFLIVILSLRACVPLSLIDIAPEVLQVSGL